MTASRHHAIDYVELTVTDLATAKRFYGEAFGWGFTDHEPAYSGIRVTEGPYAFPGGRRFHFADPSGDQLGVRAER